MDCFRLATESNAVESDVKTIWKMDIASNSFYSLGTYGSIKDHWASSTKQGPLITDGLNRSKWKGPFVGLYKTFKYVKNFEQKFKKILLNG